MGKFFGAIVRFVFLLGLLGLVGYNTLQTAQLRSEVEALRRQQGSVGKVRAPVGETFIREKVNAKDPASLLASARRHYDAAKEHLDRKEYVEAARQMTLATEATKKAGANAGALSGDKVREFQQAVQSLSARASDLLDQSEGSGSAKPKGDPRK